MGTVSKHLTPLDLIRAIEQLSFAEKETLALLADEKLSKELLARRKEGLDAMKAGELLSEDELFDKS